MIRINLLKNRGTSISSEGGADTQFTYMGEGELDGVAFNKDILVKIFLILFWTLGLISYEAYNVGKYEEKQSQLKKQQQSLKKKLAAKNLELKALGTVESEAEALENKIILLRQLADIRLRELKALDFLQSAIPDRLWLTGVNYDKGKDFIINGSAISDNDLGQLVERLEASAYFEQVIVISSTEVSSSSGTVKKFEITTQLEGQE